MGASFAPCVLPRLLGPEQTAKIAGLRQAALRVHTFEGSDAHDVIYLHGSEQRSKLDVDSAVILDEMVAAMLASDPHAHSRVQPLTVRCQELHTYRVGGCLVDPKHTDAGSTLTLSVLVSAAARGGKFCTFDSTGASLRRLRCGVEGSKGHVLNHLNF